MTEQKEGRETLQARLIGLLTFPGESPSTDYKEAKAFSAKDDFVLKLVRHILGMANSGGGSIVIGYSERDGKLAPDPALSDAVTGSYDSTSLSQTVGSHVLGEQKPSLVVEKVQYEGKHYPIICIEDFWRNPFFCRSTVNAADGKPILLQGALYVRDQHTRTVHLANPSQWEELISRCVRKRQSEMLDAFGDVITSVRTGRYTGQQPPTEEFERIVQEEAARARDALTEKGLPAEGWYFWHVPTKSAEPFSLFDLASAAEKAIRPNTGLPIGLVRLGHDEAVPSDDGLRMTHVCETGSANMPFVFERWLLHRGAGFFMYRSHDGAGKGVRHVSWTRRVWSFAEAIDHCVALYQNLNMGMETPVYFEIVHEGMKGISLTSTDPNRPWLWPGDICQSEVVKFRWEGNLSSLAATRQEIVVTACRDLFARFNFSDIPEREIRAVYQQYTQSRAR